MRLRLRAHSARVPHPLELRMGSPQYGRLLLDGEPLAGAESIEHESLTWSAGRGLLAVQQLVDWGDGPTTRVVVFDAESRTPIAASRARRGLSNPVRFEGDALLYRHWHDRAGERDLRLELPAVEAK